MGAPLWYVRVYHDDDDNDGDGDADNERRSCVYGKFRIPACTHTHTRRPFRRRKGVHVHERKTVLVRARRANVRCTFAATAARL